jgi:FeoC like transcriptional regulator
MFIAIRQYIQKQKMVTQMQVERHFQLSPMVLQPILDILKSRHDIQEMTEERCASDCGECENPRYFEWIGPEL